nr:SDR family oxidoreductase [Eikenella glucosivorans]
MRRVQPRSHPQRGGFCRQTGRITRVINTAGVSPSQASAALLFKVDLYGTAVLLEEFGKVIARGGSAVMIGSQSSHRLEPLTVEQNRALALTPAEELLDLPFIKGVDDSLRAYQLSKRGNALRVAAQAVEWGKRGARVNCISAGIIHTPLANDELNGERKDFYRAMLAALPVGRGGTPDEIANLAELMMDERGAYITGSDFLIDGGATAKFWWGAEE